MNSALQSFMHGFNFDIKDDSINVVVEALKTHEGKSVKMQLPNVHPDIETLDIRQTVYADPVSAFNDYLASVAADDITLFSWLNQTAIFDLVSSFVEEIEGSRNVDDVVVQDQAVITLHKAIMKDGTSQEQIACSFFVEVSTYNEDDIDETDTTCYFVTFTCDAIFHMENGKLVITDRLETSDMKTNFIAATLFQGFMRDVMDSIIFDETDEQHHLVMQQLDTEENVKYDRFLQIRDQLLYGVKNGTSRIYQSVKKAYPNITLSYVEESLTTVIPNFDLVLSDNEAAVQSYAAAQEIDEKEAAEELEVDLNADFDEYAMVIVAYQTDDPTNIEHEAAFQSLGFNFEDSLVFDEAKLIKELDEIKADQEDFWESLDDDFYSLGDMSINPDKPEWVQTLLIPFVRIQIERIEDVESIDPEALMATFETFVDARAK